MNNNKEEVCLKIIAAKAAIDMIQDDSLAILFDPESSRYDDCDYYVRVQMLKRVARAIINGLLEADEGHDEQYLDDLLRAC